ncbi:hypothetical protein HJC23_006633 [Cyclotella cryptica]|uniref:Sulfotransferase n=1 Tax=Cyclotella cryptica TaxID=29204 RepID=A0ABD3QZ58_9STRA|eukprot:CCRYP_001054-RA/>CCRYP_001054-RA protein AED:0.13 eAED:0.13 QI:0/-1/0/1/-1/1/1/0/415
MHIGHGIYNLPHQSQRHRFDQSLSSPPTGRNSRFIFATALIFAGVSLHGMSKIASLGSDVKTTSSYDGIDIFERLKSEMKPRSIYDELEVDSLNTTSNPNSRHGIYKYFSPYEQRFPNDRLTHGFKKSIPYNNNIPPNKQICFVHVGKAGGSTIGCSLGFSLHCSSSGQVIPNSILPVVTTHAFHRGVYDCQDDAAYFLFVIRDPLARLLSAFNYDRPQEHEKLSKWQRFHKKEFYLDCPYWTLEEVAQNGLLDSTGTTSTVCRRRARSAIRGTEQFIPHWFFNYQYYYEFIPLEAKILVIRNDHIVDDWNGIEYMLDGNGDVLNPSLLPENNVHDKNATDLYLSDDSKIALCRSLCNEIQIYKDILRRAVNFIEEDVQISLEELRLSCPSEAISDVCDEPKPDITKKINDRKFN